ncbi:DUF6527 family protein [Oceanobacillus salinisoli]|uniref:DUF6527 family protein n=1 Tax=Oceanobacillus salinisoli TaxID=2678611 RepID=UPI0012E26E94|nr:DUF6527 family protein [Oceanobacillus salinisoli]
MKIIKTDDERYMFYCEGCKRNHAFNNAWQFNDDFDKPTVSPSLKVTMPYKGVDYICHSFIRNGEIQYLNDCHHELAAKVVPLKDEKDWDADF